MTTGDDLNKLLDSSADYTGKTFTAAILHGTSSTAITVTNTNLASGQITLTVDKATHATIGGGRYHWYLDSTISGVDVRELSGEYVIL